ncbi:MAG: hypothetical protein ACFFA3_09760 [Promethearchaeota archaeon]
MVQVKDIEKLMDDFMIDTEERFIDVKRYLLSEFEWKVDPLKRSQFLIRGIPIDDDMKLGDLLKAYLPEEMVVLKEL